MSFLADRFAGLDVGVEKVPLSDDLLKDPDYSDPVPGIHYDGRYNLRLHRPGRNRGRTLLFNAHTDVVPPSEGMSTPYKAQREGGVIRGRGACDDKGQVATLFLVLSVLDSLRITLQGDVIGHLVVEEENGGNGTLAMVRRGEEADGCVVLEPSDGRLYTSIRGAVWFRILFHGKAGHSGQAGAMRSALLMARDAMSALEQFHAELLEASRGDPLFDVYPNPMPLTFGRLHAGNWPSAAPSLATLEGVLGFLPNRTKEQVCQDIRSALERHGDGCLGENFDLEFMYRHDCSVVDPAQPLPQALVESAGSVGLPLDIAGMTASCDAWFYNNQSGIPTVVYGPGTLSVAHSKDEQIRMEDIAGAAEMLVRLVLDYCGEGRG